MKIKIVKSSEIRGKRIKFNDLFTAQEKAQRTVRSIVSMLGVRKVKG